MATTTGLALLQALSEAIGDYRLLTATGGSTTTVVDTELANLTENDGGIQGFIKIVTDAGGSGAAPEGEIRRILNGTAGYTASAVTATVNFAFTAAPASGDTYELHRFSPLEKLAALQQAIRQLYPVLYLPIIDHGIIVNNTLLNSSFETFASSLFTNWTAVGSPTLTQETGIVRRPGGVSAKVVAGGSTAQLTQAPNIQIKEVLEKVSRLKFWVYATASSTARIRHDWGGSSFDNSSYHSGEDQWELLETSLAVPNSATQIKTILEVAANGTAYFAHGYHSVGRVYRYTLPTTIIDGPSYVDQQVGLNHPEGQYAPLQQAREGHIIRVEGRGLLSQPTTDTATVEVGEPHVQLIVAKAAQLLFQRVRGNPNFKLHDPDYWATEYEELEDRHKMGPTGEQRANGWWDVQEDASGKYLYLKQ